MWGSIAMKMLDTDKSAEDGVVDCDGDALD